MKQDMFGDLSADTEKKYKSFSDRAERERRATELDKKIDELAKQDRNVEWAHRVCASYQQIHATDADILDVSMGAEMLEQMKKEAEFLLKQEEKLRLAREKEEARAKAEEEKRQRLAAEQAKLDAEKEAERQRIAAQQKDVDDAKTADMHIMELINTKRSSYWCEDVDEADAFVKNISGSARSKCQNLDALDRMKREAKLVRGAIQWDKRITDTAAEVHNKQWADKVNEIDTKIPDLMRPYLTETGRLSDMKKEAADILASFEKMQRELAAAENARREEEARRRAKEEADRKAEEAAAAIAKAKAKAEIAAKREAEARAAAKALARKKRIHGIVTLLGVGALIFISVSFPDLRSYAITGAIMFFYAYLALSVLNGALWFIMLTGIPGMITVIPFLCINSALRQSAFVIAVTLVLIALKIIFREETSKESVVYGVVQGEFSALLAVIGFSLIFLHGWPRYLTIGIAGIIVFVLFKIIALSQSSLIAFVWTEFFITLGSGIGFLFVGREFTVLSMFLFLATALAYVYYGLVEEGVGGYIVAGVVFVVLTGISFIVLFVHWGYTDFIVKGDTLVHYYGAEEVLEIPEGIVNIADGCAHGKGKGVKEIYIPASVKTIGEGAFKKCKSLTVLEFAEDSQLTQVGNEAFLECKKLTGTLILPDGIETIGQYAFRYTAISEVRFGSALTQIDEAAFADVPLQKVVYNGSIEAWQQVRKAEKTHWYDNDAWDERSGDYEMVYLK